MRETGCDICGSTEKTQIYDTDRNGENVINVICQKCGLIYVDIREDEQNIKKKYADGDFSIAARGSQTPSIEKLRQSDMMAWKRFETFVSSIRKNQLSLPSGSILEIGCGLGSFLHYMEGLGMEVLGVEPDLIFSQFGANYHNLSIQPIFYEDFRWPENHFNVIASFHVLEHVISPNAFIKKTYFELKPGGLLFIEVPCIEFPNNGNLKSFFWKAHLHTFSKNTLFGLMSQNGFKILDQGYSGNFLWVLAEKSELHSEIFPVYPYDIPRSVIRNIQRSRQQFLIINSPLTIETSFQKFILNSVLFSRKIFNRRLDQIVFFLFKHTKSYLHKARDIIISKIISNFQNKPTIAHFGVQGFGNAGDVMLLVAIRKLFDEKTGPFKWNLHHVYHKVTQEIIENLNTKSQGMIIGGGGILLPDTNRNLNSGWIWDCSIEDLQKIQIPIIGFAIGFNRFRNQEEFPPVFSEHINKLINKSIFFGLRNHGSIRQLSEYLDGDAKNKLVFQPCPTTLLKFLYPKYANIKSIMQQKNLAINIAFDRRKLRYGDNENEILSQIARAVKQAELQGWKIYLVFHVSNDDRVIPWLLKEKVNFTEINLFTKTYKGILEFYQDMHLTIGMRGHSQMIPFGLGNPIISLASHEKLNYFLEDIGHMEWGIDIKNPNLENELITKIQYAENNWDTLRSEIAIAQDELWKISLENQQYIRDNIANL